MRLFIYGFSDELTKIATVSGAKKQYRRIVEILDRRKKLFHGSPSVSNIAESAKISPSSAGRYGPGVYMWKEHPRAPYFTKKLPGGVIVDAERAGPGKPLLDAVTGRQPPRETIEAINLREGALPLVAKDTIVAKRSRELSDKLRRNRLRHIDPEIMQRATMDLRARRLAKAGKLDLSRAETRPPSDKELKNLVLGRKSTPAMKADLEKFEDQYKDLVSK